MSRVVLDSSAVLAVLNNEPGAEKLTLKLLSNAASSTVNLAEVQAKLVSRGATADEAWANTISPINEAMPLATLTIPVWVLRKKRALMVEGIGKETQDETNP